MLRAHEARKLQVRNGLKPAIRRERHNFRFAAFTNYRVYRSKAYNPETGIVTRKITVNPLALADAIVNSLGGQGYFRVNIKGQRYQLHRIIWKMTHNTEPPEFLDHGDGNRSNNRISNLRPAEASSKNHKRQRQIGASGFIGVRKADKSPNWYTRVMAHGKCVDAYGIPTAFEAALIRDFKADLYHGEFAVLNFPLWSDPYDHPLAPRRDPA